MRIIILNQLLKSTVHSFMFLSSIGLLLCTSIRHAQGSGDVSPRSPTKIETKQIFDRLTRNSPTRVHIIAEAEVISEPASEEEIRVAAEGNAKRMAKREGREVTEEFVESLVKLFHVDLSGFKKINYELWRSRRGTLYRLDKVDLSTGTEPYDWMDVNIRDTTFTNIPHFSGSKRRKSVTLQWDLSQRVEELQLWDVYGVELQLKMPIILALGANFTKIPQSEEEMEAMISQVRLDDQKLDALVRGSNPAWKMTAFDIEGEESALVRFVLVGDINIPMPKRIREQVSENLFNTRLRTVYEFEKGNLNRLRKAELFNEQNKMSYHSRRWDYDVQNIPMRWEHWEHHPENGENARPIKTLYKFKLVDGNPSFDDWTIFAPEFPDDYIVGELHGDGYSKIIRNPGGGEIKNPKKETKRSSSILAILGYLAILVLIVVAMRRYGRERKNRN